MTLEEFVKKYRGKGIDFDKNGKFWCVDLYRQYCKEVLEVPQSPLVSGAVNIWDTYLKEYFDRINNEPASVPNKGDIVIWSKKTGNGFGHVAIFIEGDVLEFKSLDQNWPIGRLCSIAEHSYTNILGWLRLKKVEQNKELEEHLMVHKKLMDELKKKDEEINKLKEVRDDYQNKWKIEEVKSEQEKRLFKEFRQELAAKLGCGQSQPEILGQIEGLVQKEDTIDKVKRDFDAYKSKAEEFLKKLGVMLYTPPEEKAVLDTIQAMTEDTKDLNKTIEDLQQENLKQRAIIERYKQIVSKKKYTPKELLKMLLESLFRKEGGENSE